MPEVTIIQPLSKAEIREEITAINNSAADIGRRLIRLKEGRAWETLGYPNWVSFLEGEFTYTRRRLNEFMNAAPVIERLGTTVPKISTEAALALSRFDEDLQPVIAKTAVARYGKVTESNVARVGNVIQEMATTGHVDTGNGTSTPIDAALAQEDFEALQRQQEYINYKRDAKASRAANEYEPKGYDSCQTPAYAIDPLLPYLPRSWQLWEPAAGEGLLVEAFYDSGFTVVHQGDILTGQNFFETEPEDWDCLITNPPFSLKYRWLERCYTLAKPFALLLPVETLGAKSAQVLFRAHGVEVVFLDRRVNFKMPYKGWEGSAQFPVAWFTWGLDIGQQMTFAEVHPDE